MLLQRSHYLSQAQAVGCKPVPIHPDLDLWPVPAKNIHISHTLQPEQLILDLILCQQADLLQSFLLWQLGA